LRGDFFRRTAVDRRSARSEFCREPNPDSPVRISDWYRSIAVERVDAAVEPSLGSGRIDTPVNGVPSHVLTTFIPAQATLRRDFYARMFLWQGWRSGQRLTHEIENAQPIALCMAAISAR
jgi:hypothetical protein